MKKFLPAELIVETGSESSPIYQNLRRTLPQVPVKIVEDVDSVNVGDFRHGDFFGAAKKKLYLMRHRGEFFKKCPGSDGQVCCNYFVINFASNCPMDCSYRYMQDISQTMQRSRYSAMSAISSMRLSNAAKAPRRLFSHRHRRNHRQPRAGAVHRHGARADPLFCRASERVAGVEDQE